MTRVFGVDYIGRWPDGPGRSWLAVQVIMVAAATIRAIQPMPTAACMAKLLEISVRITRPANDSSTPEQYIASEFSPQRMSPLSSASSGARPRGPAPENARGAAVQGGFCRSVDQLRQRIGHRSFERLDMPTQRNGETE